MWQKLSLVAVVLSLLFGGTLAHAAPWRFVVSGDTRSTGEGDQGGVNVTVLSEIANQVATMSVKPDFIMVPGDLPIGQTTSTATLTTELTLWKNTMMPVYNAGINVYATWGNHEWTSTNAATVWNNVFTGTNSSGVSYAMPTNGPTAERGLTYSVVHNNALIISLDESSYTVNQTWLTNSSGLTSSPSAATPHVFAQGHLPLFTTDSHTDTLNNYPTNRNTFVNSLKAAGGRTYFCGHDHLYDRGTLNDGDGVTYNDFEQMLVGSGGAPLNGIGTYSSTSANFTPSRVFGDSSWGYLTVDIDGPNATYTWYHRTGTNTYAYGGDTYSYVLGGLLWDGGAGNGNWNGNNNWDSNAAIADGSALTFAGTIQQTTSNNSTLTHAGQVTLKGGFTCSGGTLTLDAGMSNYLNNTWAINSKLSADQTFYGSSGTLAFNGTLDTNGKALTIDGPGNYTFAGAVSGSGSLTKAASSTSTLTLGAANTYSGDTLVNGGTLLLTNSLALQQSTLNTSGSGAISFDGLGAAALGGLKGPKNFALATNFALTVGNNGQNTTYDGVLSGSGVSFTKTGSGRLTLGGNNLYGGATSVKQGVLQIADTDHLPTGTAVSLDNTAGAALDLNGKPQTIASLAGGGPLGGNVTLGAGTLTVAGAGSTTFQGTISGTGGMLKKQGTGALTLTGSNSYTGGTTVSGGMLGVNNALALPTGKTLTIGGGGSVVLQSGLTQAIQLGGLTITSGAGDVGQASPLVQDPGQAGSLTHEGGQAGSVTYDAAPTPEPGTIALLAAAVLGAIAAGRGRRRR